MGIIGLITQKGNPSKLPYINKDCIYEISPYYWQLIRPSYLFFLNKVIPIAANPWEKNQGLLQIAEIGVAGGINAKNMLQALDFVFLHMIEDCRDLQTPISLLENTEPFKDRRRFLQKSSVKAAKDYKDEFFDYVYIDASHDYENTINDIKVWYPKVKFGGMLAGHDWCLEGVSKAVREFMEGCPQRLFAVQNFLLDDTQPDAERDLALQGSDWWFTKTNIVHK